MYVHKPSRHEAETGFIVRHIPSGETFLVAEHSTLYYTLDNGTEVDQWDSNYIVIERISTLERLLEQYEIDPDYWDPSLYGLPDIDKIRDRIHSHMSDLEWELEDRRRGVRDLEDRVSEVEGQLDEIYRIDDIINQ